MRNLLNWTANAYILPLGTSLERTTKLRRTSCLLLTSRKSLPEFLPRVKATRCSSVIEARKLASEAGQSKNLPALQILPVTSPRLRRVWTEPALSTKIRDETFNAYGVHLGNFNVGKCPLRDKYYAGAWRACPTEEGARVTDVFNFGCFTPLTKHLRKSNKASKLVLLLDTLKPDSQQN